MTYSMPVYGLLNDDNRCRFNALTQAQQEFRPTGLAPSRINRKKRVSEWMKETNPKEIRIGNSCGIRVSRFTVQDDGSIKKKSRTALLETGEPIPSQKLATAFLGATRSLCHKGSQHCCHGRA